jgi:hypothetical protein
LTTSRRLNISSWRGGPIGGAADLLDVVAHRVVGGQLARGEADAGEDHRQQVVEVVRDPARELADALQPLGLREAVLELGALLGAAAALGDVGGDRDDRGDLAVDVAQRELDHQEGPLVPPVGLGDDHHRLVRLAGRADALVDLEVVGAAGRGQQLLRRAPDRLIGGHAEELLPAAVDQQIAVLQILDDDQRGRVVDDRLEALLAGAALGLGAAALGDVDELAEEVERALAVAVHERDVHERVDHHAVGAQVALLDRE